MLADRLPVRPCIDRTSLRRLAFSWAVAVASVAVLHVFVLLDDTALLGEFLSLVGHLAVAHPLMYLAARLAGQLAGFYQSAEPQER